MVIVGITGGIGSGKSTIAKVFESLGYPVYQADAAAKQCYVQNPALKKAVVHLLGKESYTGTGTLNTAFISQQVFSDEEKLKKLNALVHPAVKEHYQQWLTKHAAAKLIVKEAAILIETGGHKEVDFTILVTTRKQIRIQRVLKRDSLTLAEIENRINKQWTDEQKIPFADLIINNDNSALILDTLLVLPSKLINPVT
ncbi:MAG: dephospho-CoA kinase [Flavobacteriales bacterium]|jgi:dephospho-CoA kinase